MIDRGDRQIRELTERVKKLENMVKEFMENWGPDVQKRRDERDERWDEMVRVLTIQKKHEREKVSEFAHLSLDRIDEVKYDGDGKPLGKTKLAEEYDKSGSI